jgi:hypothetical protein
MNLIEGGRPRIGCIRRQPSARSFILSLEEGHPSMGKIAGSSGKKGGRASGAPQLPGDRCSGRGASGGSTRGREGPRRGFRGAGRASRWSPEIAEQIRVRLISRSRGARRRTAAGARNGPSSEWERC